MQFIYELSNAILKVKVFVGKESKNIGKNTNYNSRKVINVCKIYLFMILLSCKYYEKLKCAFRGGA